MAGKHHIQGMRRPACIMLAAFLALGAYAEIRWISKDYDFGLMKEVEGPRTGVSRFVNIGTDTVSIFSVKPSCGCTSADFSTDPIAPGDTATISYTYNPDRRPGKFDKTVKVRMTDGSRYNIRITGNVLGTRESATMLYPVDAGEMRLSENVVNAGEVFLGRTPVFFINAYSLQSDTIRPSLTSPHKAVAVTTKSPEAAPGETVTYSLTFLSTQAGKYGPVDIPLTFKATPESEPVTVSFRAYVVPDTQRLMIAQKGKNPAIAFDANTICAGENITEPKIRAEIRFANRGSGPLKILSISSPSEAMIVKGIPSQVKPGKSAAIKIELDMSKIPDGAFRLPVDIITDDPDRPRQTVTLTGINKN